MKYNIFMFIYERLGPYLKKKDVQFRGIVSVQYYVVILLHRLGSGDGLQNIGDFYEVYKSTLSKIVKKYFRVVGEHLQHRFGQTPNESMGRSL